MENLTGRFTREHRVSNFINSRSWKVSKDGILYIWYDGHRLDFHKSNNGKQIDIDLDKKHYITYKDMKFEDIKKKIINHLIDEGIYAIRKDG